MDNNGQWDITETQSGGKTHAPDAAAAPDTWLSAIRGLRDNPLAQAHKLIQHRKSKCALIYWWLASLLSSAAIVAFYVLTLLPMARSGLIWIGEVWISAIHTFLFVLWLFWLPRVLYLACANWLGCLNRQQPRANRLLDEYLAYSKLSDREIVIGIGVNTFKPLILPVLLVIALLLASQWVYAFRESLLPHLYSSSMIAQLGSEYGKALATAQEHWRICQAGLPVTTLISAISMVLGAAFAIASLFLLLLGIGARNVTPIFVHIEAGLIAGLQTIWMLMAVMLNKSHIRMLLEWGQLKLYLWGNMNAGTAALLLLILFLCLFLLLPRKWNVFKGALVIIVGFMQNAIAMMFPFCGWIYGELTVQKSFAVSSILLLSVFNAVNPMLITLGSYSNVYASSYALPPLPVFSYRVSEALFLLVIQLILLPLLARFALTSVRRFRQAEE